MDARDFQRMFDYDSWANRECLVAMSAAEGVPAEAVGRMAHILSAQKLWLERLRNEPQSTPVWPTSTIEDCLARVEEMREAWRNYIALRTPSTSASFAAKIEYRNSKGEPWSSRVEDVLTHVLFHSAYHRGQVALQMRACGLTPAYTDFIHAVRQGFVD